MMAADSFLGIILSPTDPITVVSLRRNRPEGWVHLCGG